MPVTPSDETDIPLMMRACLMACTRVNNPRKGGQVENNYETF